MNDKYRHKSLFQQVKAMFIDKCCITKSKVLNMIYNAGYNEDKAGAEKLNKRSITGIKFPFQ